MANTDNNLPKEPVLLPMSETSPDYFMDTGALPPISNNDAETRAQAVADNTALEYAEAIRALREQNDPAGWRRILGYIRKHLLAYRDKRTIKRWIKEGSKMR